MGMMSPLSASETSSAIQARIEGLQMEQVAPVNRLRELGIPQELIQEALLACKAPGTPFEQQDGYEMAETRIITYVMDTRKVSAAEAIDILNGRVIST